MAQKTVSELIKQLEESIKEDQKTLDFLRKHEKSGVSSTANNSSPVVVDISDNLTLAVKIAKALESADEFLTAKAILTARRWFSG